MPPVAMQQGRYGAKVMLRRLRGKETPPFRYRDKGNLATIGRARAVADVKRVRLSGFPAWFIWLAVHITYLISFQNRLLVLIRWAFSFVTRGRGARLITDPAAELPAGLRGQLAADRSPVLGSEAPPVGALESMKQLE